MFKKDVKAMEQGKMEELSWEGADYKDKIANYNVLPQTGSWDRKGTLKRKLMEIE